MSELRVRLDPRNPGQFFACCGLLELAEIEAPGTLGRFALDPSMPRRAEFLLDGSADLRGIMARLKSAIPEFDDQAVEEAAVRPAAIPYNGTKLVLDWWLDEFRLETTNLKCWAGQVTTRNLFCELLPLIERDCSGDSLFDHTCMTKAKFGVDPRSAWTALDFGFSPNEHAADAATFPAVEILAAVGLQGFRPDTKRRSEVSYTLWQTSLPAAVARMAFRVPWTGMPGRRFRFAIAKRGQSYKYFTFAEMLGKDGIDQ